MSLRKVIKKILTEEVESEDFESVQDIMTTIDLNNDEIESMFSRMGINIDLDKISSFGSIGRIKAAGEFGFSFELSKPVKSFGKESEIVGVAKYSKKSSDDALVLDFIKRGSKTVVEIHFDKNTLVKDIPMSASARKQFNLFNDATKLKDRKVMVAPGLVKGEIYNVIISRPSSGGGKVYQYTTSGGKKIFVTILTTSDMEEGYVYVTNIDTGKGFAAKKNKLKPTDKSHGDQRIKIKDVSFITDTEEGGKGGKGKTTIGKEPVPVSGKIHKIQSKNDKWTDGTAERFINNKLSKGSSTIYTMKPTTNPNEFILKFDDGSYITLKPKSGGDFGNLRNWRGVSIKIGKNAIDKNNFGEAEAEIILYSPK